MCDEKAVALEPTSDTALMRLATTLKGAPEASAEVERRFLDLITLSPDSLGVWLDYGQYLQSGGRLPEAERAFRRAGAFHPAAFEPSFFLGLLFKSSGQSSLALREFDKAAGLARAAGKHTSAAVSLGEAGKKEECIAVLREGLRLHPDNLVFMLYLAHWLVAFERFDEAYAVIQRTIGDCPEYISAKGELAMLLHGQGRFEEAEPLFREAVAHQPMNDGWHVYIGIGLLYRGHFIEAETEYREALRLNPKNPIVMAALGQTLAERGVRLNEAQDLVERALAVAPKNASYLLAQGLVQYRQGEVDAAEVTLRRSMPNLDYSMAWAILGRVYEAKGKPQQAREAYDKAVKLGSPATNPWHREAQAALRRLSKARR